MSVINVEVNTERRGGLRFEDFPDKLHDDLLKEIEALTLEAFAIEVSRVPVLTGDLASKFRHYVHDDPDDITGTVYLQGEGSGSYSDFAIAGTLEYGSTGEAFERKSHSMQLDHYWANRLAAPETVTVKLINAPGHIIARQFARGAKDAMQPQIVARLTAVLQKDLELVSA